jgi:hypothetical protein
MFQNLNIDHISFDEKEELKSSKEINNEYFKNKEINNEKSKEINNEYFETIEIEILNCLKEYNLKEKKIKKDSRNIIYYNITKPNENKTYIIKIENYSKSRKKEILYIVKINTNIIE